MKTDWSDFIIDLNVMVVGMDETSRRQDPKRKHERRSSTKPAARGGFAPPTELARFQGQGIDIVEMEVPPDGIW